MNWAGDSIEGAKEAFDKYDGGKDWAQIVEHETMKIVATLDCPEYGFGDGTWKPCGSPR